MVISKVLNNNVVIALKDDRTELVLMGTGLGFQKKVGNHIDDEKIQKTFELKGDLDSLRVEEMLSEIPEDIIEMSYRILKKSKEKLNKEMNETAFLSFADHLHTAIQRSEKNIQLKNFLLWDIKRFFPKELAIAQEGIRWVNEEMNTNLSEDEAGFLTLHIVNAEIDNSSEDAIKLTQLIEEILTTIKYTLKINFVEQDIYFQRFITHLRFFSERVIRASNGEHEEDNRVESELFELITTKYKEAYIATKKVVELLANRWNYEVSPDEQVYITIHLARIMDKSKN
ncbi:BglG family transcription antiterminator LicT [Vagococcus fluvialis]|uniref:BglG family transcription antiterminator LicT n=1 Tax=Vagococcus fluvialis TaxID=2738 RepID=UPI001A906B78|nr:PRD domain-containing protein [Vagococcus fluvialis]MBO0441985.1 PRD domain-containing protein [Vagococcus fluvialis]